MKRFAIVVLCFSIPFVFGCSTIDVAVNKRVDLNKRLDKIAVFPFQVRQGQWGDEFSDAITHHLFKSGRVEVVEREAMQKILKEQNLSMTGIVDDSNAARLGKLLGADVIITGRGSCLSDNTTGGKEQKNLIDTFSLKAISVETGSLLVTVRKEPGIAWAWWARMKWCCSLSLIWDRNDLLIETSRYDEIARQIAGRIVEAISQIEKAQ
ncbi:MAG TPA: CsgG/HfaB family protein [Spirochaetota bacterium]|nr:CsgG/HfaB family protein [Spirochaetota bacterium]HQP48714.1 CsgG/HfaB family protein [Spirochaetota bacterium]